MDDILNKVHAHIDLIEEVTECFDSGNFSLIIRDDEVELAEGEVLECEIVDVHGVLPDSSVQLSVRLHQPTRYEKRVVDALMVLKEVEALAGFYNTPAEA